MLSLARKARLQLFQPPGGCRWVLSTFHHHQISAGGMAQCRASAGRCWPSSKLASIESFKHHSTIGDQQKQKCRPITAVLVECQMSKMLSQELRSREFQPMIRYLTCPCG